MARVAGLDARPGGWVLVVVEEGRLAAMERHASLAGALAEVTDVAVVGVDLPLGHDDPDGRRRGVRACDVAARLFLGPVGDRVDPVPPLSVFEVDDLAAARGRAETAGWPVPSTRLWALRARMDEVAVARDARFVEVHPEVSFHALLRHGEPDATLGRSERSWRGVSERLALLNGVGLRPARSFGGIGLVSPQDVLRATIVAWTAWRVVTGAADFLPAEGAVRIAC